MKLARGAVALLALVAIGAAGKTREEVLRELAEARRMGDTIASGCGGGTLREAFPHRYPAESVTSTNDTSANQRRAEDATPRERRNARPESYR